MYQLLYVITTGIRFLLDIVMIAMLLRAILSWLFIDEAGNVFTSILYAVTEPFIVPIRYLCERFGWFEGLPIDMSFFLTAILLSVIRSFLIL